MKKAMINYMKLPKNDELYTPEYAIKPLIKYLKEYEKIYIPDDDPHKRPLAIWECTDYGSSNITKVLRDNGKSSYFNTSWFCKNILPEKLIFEELIKDE